MFPGSLIVLFQMQNRALCESTWQLAVAFSHAALAAPSSSGRQCATGHELKKNKKFRSICLVFLLLTIGVSEEGCLSSIVHSLFLFFILCNFCSQSNICKVILSVILVKSCHDAFVICIFLVFAWYMSRACDCLYVFLISSALMLNTYLHPIRTLFHQSDRKNTLQ